MSDYNITTLRQKLFFQIEEVEKQKGDEIDIIKVGTLCNLTDRYLKAAMFEWQPEKTKEKRNAIRIKPIPKKLPKPEPGYWDDIHTVKQQIIQYLQTLNGEGSHNRMPTGHELECAGLKPLIDAIYNHGGFKKVAETLGLEWIEE